MCCQADVPSCPLARLANHNIPQDVIEISACPTGNTLQQIYSVNLEEDGTRLLGERLSEVRQVLRQPAGGIP